MILQGNTSKKFYEAHFAWILNERHPLLRRRTAILNGREGWNQIKLETDLFLFWWILYLKLTKLTKKQKHTSCIEGQNSKSIVLFFFFIHLLYLTIGSNCITFFSRYTWNWVLCKRQSLRSIHSVDNLSQLNLSITRTVSDIYTVGPNACIFCNFIIFSPSKSEDGYEQVSKRQTPHLSNIPY